MLFRSGGDIGVDCRATDGAIRAGDEGRVSGVCEGEREGGSFYDRGSRGYRSFYSDFHGDVWRDGLLIGVTGLDVMDKRREFELEILNL